MNLNWKPGGEAIVGSPVWMKLDGVLLRAPSSRRRSSFPLVAGSSVSTIPNDSPSPNGTALYDVIVRRAVAIGIGSATEQEIDRLNILEATRLAMRRAIASLTFPPDCLLIDAIALPAVTIQTRSIIKGDTLSISIAAASIVAKVTRDRMMVAYHRTYPAL